MSTLPANQRIVVTGMGIISAIGEDIGTFFQNACAGRSGISQVRSFAVGQMNSDRGGEIHDFNIGRHFPGRNDLRALGRCKQLALAAAQQCLRQAAGADGSLPANTGVAFGYTQGESGTLEKCTEAIHRGELQAADVAAFADYLPQSVPQQLAAEFGLNGPLLTIANACSASSFAIGAAIDLLRQGESTAMLVGGADAFSRYGYAGFSRLGAIAPDVPRPFSADRHGMVPGEGAAMILVETLASAQARNAPVIAEIIGYGESCDAHHITQPNPAGIVQAVQAALDEAGLSPSDVSFISAHGTGTLASDQAESTAFHQLFGPEPPPVTAVKSMLGHAMGAASSMEYVAALCSLRHQILTPTANYLGLDEACRVDCVPNVARPGHYRIALKTASAFGGNNAAVLFSAWQPNHDSTQEP